MAKKNLGRLAGLAALAGAAYMGLKDKDKDKGSDSNSTRAARPESIETRLKSPAESIAAADKSDKSTSISTKGEAGTTTPGTDKSVPILDVKPAPAVPKTATPSRTPTTAKTAPRGDSSRVDLEAGMSRGTRTVRNDNYSNEGRSSAKPPSTVSSSAEGMKNYKPRVTPPAAPFRGGQPGYDEAGNFLGGRRGYDEAGNPMKKGGKVKKMASGGMTASSRADGIATRGKTKCKMY